MAGFSGHEGTAPPLDQHTLKQLFFFDWTIEYGLTLTILHDTIFEMTFVDIIVLTMGYPSVTAGVTVAQALLPWGETLAGARGLSTPDSLEEKQRRFTSGHTKSGEGVPGEGATGQRLPGDGVP